MNILIRSFFINSKHLLKLNRKSFVFKSFDFPEEYYQVYEIGLKKNYFNEFSNTIKSLIKIQKYEEAISEYNLFIHNIEMYLDMDIAFSKLFYLEHLIKLINIYLDSYKFNESSYLIEKAFTFIVNNELFIKEFKQVVNKLVFILKKSYEHQVSYLLFTNENLVDLRYSYLNQNYYQIVDKLILFRKSIINSIKTINSKPLNEHTKIVVDSLIFLEKKIIIKIINSSIFLLNNNITYLMNLFFKELDVNLLENDILEKFVYDKETKFPLLENLSNNDTYKLIKFKLSYKNVSDLKELEIMIYQIKSVLETNLNKKLNDFIVDYTLLLLISVDIYLQTNKNNIEINKISLELIFNFHQNFNYRNYFYYNKLKKSIIEQIKEIDKSNVKKGRFCDYLNKFELV